MHSQRGLINLYNEAIMRELEFLSRFIIGDETSLIKKKVKEQLQKIIKEREKKGQIINYKKTEYMVLNKRNSL